MSLIFIFPLNIYAQFTVAGEKIEASYSKTITGNEKLRDNYFTIDNKEDQQVVLKADKCSVLKKQILALIEFNKKEIAQKENFQIPECVCTDKFCSVNITTLLPQEIASRANSNPSCHGPNCWNNALVTGNILPSHRYTSQEEINFWLNSPLCREREVGEAPRPGDIIAIRQNQFSKKEKPSQEYHGFTYISPELSYSKNGYIKSQPYAIQKLENVFKVYGINSRRCYHVKGKPHIIFGGCPKYGNYFRCLSLEEYLEKNPGTSLEVTKKMEELDMLQCQITRSVFENPLSQTAKENIKDAIFALDGYINNKLNETKNNQGHEQEGLSATDILLLLGAREAINACVEQLYFMGTPGL